MSLGLSFFSLTQVTLVRSLMEIVLRTDLEETPVILNDQLGRGRSTVASVIVLLTQDWLARHRSRLSSEPAEILPYQEEDAITEGESTVRRSRDTRQHARPVGAPSRATSARAGSKSGAMSWQGELLAASRGTILRLILSAS